MTECTCSIVGCERSTAARCWCHTHYKRWQKWGDPMADHRPPKPAPCSIEGCDRASVAHGWCYSHYTQRKRAGDPAIGRKVYKFGCTIEGCQGKHSARGWCSVHYKRWQKWGDPLGEAQRVGHVNRLGYRSFGWRSHPLATARGGEVSEHRVVLWEAIGPGTHACRWCGKDVSWDKSYPKDAGGLVVDHLDDNPGNNDRSNLVPSCGRCNLRRGNVGRPVAARRADA